MSSGRLGQAGPIRERVLARRGRPGFAERAASRATGLPPAALQSGGHEGPAATALALGVPGAMPAGRGGRWGLVLGGGGVLGAAWLIGVLAALERSRGIDARDATLITGTSAGSVIGALLAAGVGVHDQREREATGREHLGATRIGSVGVGDEVVTGPWPPLPRMRPGSTAIIRNNRGALRQLPRTALLAGLAPAGRGSMAGVQRLIEAVVPAAEWAPHPGYRAVTLDYETGRRVVFGSPGAPAAGLSRAVAASCAIPGWFEPVTIGGRRYVDGGAWSATNADLMVDAGLDELFIVAPMVSLRYDAPGDVRARMERRIRVGATRRCLAEARLVQAAGTAVTVIGPGPRELELMGYNLMAASGRAEVMESGFQTALAALDELSAIGGEVVHVDVGPDAADLAAPAPPMDLR